MFRFGRLRSRLISYWFNKGELLFSTEFFHSFDFCSHLSSISVLSMALLYALLLHTFLLPNDHSYLSWIWFLWYPEETIKYFLPSLSFHQRSLVNHLSFCLGIFVSCHHEIFLCTPNTFNSTSDLCAVSSMSNHSSITVFILSWILIKFVFSFWYANVLCVNFSLHRPYSGF